MTGRHLDSSQRKPLDDLIAETREQCAVGIHADPDNSGMCIHCDASFEAFDPEDEREIAERLKQEARARRFRRHEQT